jgi:hypothetical protein
VRPSSSCLPAKNAPVNTFFILDLGFHIVDSVGLGLNLERNGLAGEGLDENLHTTTIREDEERDEGWIPSGCYSQREERDEGWPGFLLDVVVKESAKTKNEIMMKGGFLLDVVVKESAKTKNEMKGGFLLDVVVKESAKTENEMKGGFLLNVKIRKSATVFELLASEDKTLLIRWDALLVLNLGLHIQVNRVRGLDFQSDRFAS